MIVTIYCGTAVFIIPSIADFSNYFGTKINRKRPIPGPFFDPSAAWPQTLPTTLVSPPARPGKTALLFGIRSKVAGTIAMK